MKSLVLAFAVVLAPLVNATSVTIKSDDPKQSLQPLPQATIGLLTDYGFKLKEQTNGVWKVEVKNLHCDYRHRGAWDTEDALAGVPTTVCRFNSKNVQDTKRGHLIHETTGIQNILRTLGEDGRVFFTDCAMGYCGTWAPLISCTVDTKIPDFSAGRFSCTYTDGI